MNSASIDLREVISSQIPALALLQNMGYTYITPAAALAYRQEKRSKVVLEDILTAQLRKLNQIDRSGKIYRFSDAKGSQHESIVEISHTISINSCHSIELRPSLDV